MAYKDALTGTIAVVELYKFTYADSTVKLFTSYGPGFTYSGDTYVAVFISRTSFLKDTTLSVGEIKVSLVMDSTKVDTDAILNERQLDNGMLELYSVQISDVSNFKLLFKGTVSDVNLNNEVIEITVRDNFNLFRKRIPRLGHSESCPYRHGDSDCTVVINDFKVTGTAGAGSDTNTIVDAGLTQADEYFNGGYVKITSGTDNGKKRPIASYVVGTIELLFPFDNTTLTETYDAHPHCEKVFSKCDTIFSNSANFGAFQNMPRNEQVLL